MKSTNPLSAPALAVMVGALLFSTSPTALAAPGVTCEPGVPAAASDFTGDVTTQYAGVIVDEGSEIFRNGSTISFALTPGVDSAGASGSVVTTANGLRREMQPYRFQNLDSRGSITWSQEGINFILTPLCDEGTGTTVTGGDLQAFDIQGGALSSARAEVERRSGLT